MTGRIRVLVADDEALIRETLADVVRSDRELELVALATDGGEAIELAKAHRPDVAIVDVKMGGGGGPRATREIRTTCPGTRVLALSAFDDRGAVMEMLRAGAAGYLVKGASVDHVLEAIHRAARDQGSLSPEVAGDVIHELTGHLEREGAETDRRRLVAKRIREALEGEDTPRMVFQPIFELGTGRVVGAEALARFPGEHGPEVWFRDATSVGLGVDLELKAVRTAVGSIDRLPPGAYASLNLSPEAVTSGSLWDALAPVSSERVVVEITEHAPVEDYGSLADALRDFRSAGGRLAIDDAGAGFASLRHIVRLAPDIIKLDVSLTRDIHADRIRRALAAALISFAAETGAVIVAEGVEEEAELEALRGLGVPQAQGYFLSRPLHPDDLAAVGGRGEGAPPPLGDVKRPPFLLKHEPRSSEASGGHG